jgi:serine/threonine-protein kinase
VAIKVLPEAVATDPERLARFEREAKVLAALDHPNIAAIYGLEEAEGRQLLVMQLVEGETLQECIAHGAMPVDEALPIALQMAEALEAAHERGIIHRDLKPANVKVTADGKVKVLDFGLAKALEGDPSSSGSQPAITQSPTLTAQMTEAGMLLGTAAYMSPEQARGQAADRRADIWGFGVVLMELLTGKTVYAAETVSDTLAGVLAREPEWGELPRTTPRAIRRLLERCLEKESRVRLRDIGEARIAIEHFLAHGEAEAPPAAAAEARPAWRRALPWGLFGAAVVALVATLVTLWPEPPVPQPTVRLEASLSDHPLYLDLGASVELSPDGSRLAYVAVDGDSRILYTRTIDQLEGTALAEGGIGDWPYHPFFSPDGQWVGYVTPNELKKVPVTGGTPITLCEVDRNRGVSWGLDDSIVLTPNPGSGLFTVPAAGGEPQPLTILNEDKAEISHRWPQALPDGKTVIFTVATAEMSGADEAIIEAASLASGERKVLHTGGYYGRYVPTGHLVFMRDGTLFARPFDVDRLEPTGSAAPLVQGIATNTGPGGAHVSFANNGTLAYVGGEIGVPEYPIVWVDRDGKISTLWETRGSYGEPALSPDGKKLAVSMVRDGNWDVWVYDLEREVATRLTFDDAYDADQVWTPDGRQLIFTSDRGGGEGIYRKRADGSGDAEALLVGEDAYYPFSVSGDGRFLAGEMIPKGTDEFNIFVLPLAGAAEPEVFLATDFAERHPDISPDGRWIAYTSNESGRFEIYVRPHPAAGGKWQISDGGGTWPVWARSGRELFYRTNQGIMVASIEVQGDSLRVGTPQEVVKGDFRGGLFGISVGGYLFADYDVSPDGQRLVMFPEDADPMRKTHVTMVFNWFNELQSTLPSSAR